MLNESNYLTFYLVKMKSEEMLKEAEMARLGREAARYNRKTARNAVITHILEGAGNALVTTGNKILRIA